VVLISGPTALTPPAGATYVPVQTAEEMREAALHHIGTSTIVIKAAAVADYRVQDPSNRKIKSKKDEGLTLSLVPNPDILKELASRKGGAFLVGFAAETHEVRAYAAQKLSAKGIDLMVANDVSRSGVGFEADDNEVLLLDRWGGAVELPRMTKLDVGHAILDRVIALRTGAPAATPDRTPR
jgi:phosphopantothenoylcysteine decarboxylase/phosphopantothenate--cysteine ligase